MLQTTDARHKVKTGIPKRQSLARADSELAQWPSITVGDPCNDMRDINAGCPQSTLTCQPHNLTRTGLHVPAISCGRQLQMIHQPQVERLDCHRLSARDSVS